MLTKGLKVDNITVWNKSDRQKGDDIVILRWEQYLSIRDLVA